MMLEIDQLAFSSHFSVLWTYPLGLRRRCGEGVMNRGFLFEKWKEKKGVWVL